MRLRNLLFVSAMTWSLLPACKAQREPTVTSGAADAHGGAVSESVGEGARGAESAVGAAPARDGGTKSISGESAGGSVEGAPTAGGPATTSGGPKEERGAGQPRTIARAELTGPQASGQVTIRAEPTGITRLLVNVQKAPRGRHLIYVLDGSDCAAAAKSLAASSKPSTGKNAGKAAAPEAPRSLGAIEVDGGGQGTAEVPLMDTANLDKRLVILMPESETLAPGRKATTTHTACGPLRIERGVEGAGS